MTGVGLHLSIILHTKLVNENYFVMVKLTREATVVFKEKFLKDPVIVAGIQRGLAVDEEKAATAQNLSRYLMLRGKQLGYEVELSFYAIRSISSSCTV